MNSIPVEGIQGEKASWLYVTPRGLTTSSIPSAARTFEMQFDFISHNLSIQTSDGLNRFMSLYPRSVADFYRELMAVLKSMGLDVKINPMPQDVPEPIRCDKIISMPLMTQITLIVFGVSWFRWITSSRRSEEDMLERAAQSNSGEGALIWQ